MNKRLATDKRPVTHMSTGASHPQRQGLFLLIETVTKNGRVWMMTATSEHPIVIANYVVLTFLRVHRPIFGGILIMAYPSLVARWKGEGWCNAMGFATYCQFSYRGKKL